MTADVYRAYYTRSAPIVQYMVGQLAAAAGQHVLEPCAGDGVLMDALPTGTLIDAFELDPQALACLREKYGHMSRVRIYAEDALIAPPRAVYDRVIANPPYGGWQEYARRAALKRMYPGLYIKETYSLFLYRCIHLLRDGGRLVFILPDTFLHLHRQTALRKFLWTNTRVEQIVIFPSAFFPSVSFGYANLAIITLERCSEPEACLENKVHVITGLSEVEDLYRIQPSDARAVCFSQRELFANLDHALFVTDNPQIAHILNSPDTRIGDLADCVTGFYSGDDRRYLRSAQPGTKYTPVERAFINDGDTAPDLEGITGARAFIPMVKGGAVRYIKPDTWYIDWSTSAVTAYKVSKKARFQNARYYFREGIAVPMVSASRVTAALLERRLFDQSIVGVFPHAERWLHYLLAFFNSPTSNRLIRTLNPSANNSANYIRKLPFITPPPRIYDEVVGIVSSIIASLKRENAYDPAHDERLAALFQAVYGF